MPRPRASPSPPPASFPFTAGNFDYPHASTSPPRSRGDSISRGSQWASYLSRRLDHDSRASAEQEDGMPPRPAAADDGRRRPTYRPSTQYLSRTSASTSTSGTTRPRATPSERYLRRSQARRREQRAADMESTTDILDSLSEIPIANPFALPTSSVRPRSPTGELDGPRRQNKRRKLDHETTGSTDYGFKYGYKGQVVAGRLKMEIFSCDGGEYDKHSTSGGLYKVQNVLKNDKSVYCSESSRCNLLLKHFGEAPFCLEKVVIRAPDRGFTAPVQEGLVFVSMSPDELLSGTSAYQIQYYPHSPIMSPASSSPDEQHLSLREAIEDPYIWQHSRQGAQEEVEDQIERLRLRSRLHMESSERPNRDRQREERREPEIEEEDDEDDVLGEHCDYTNDDVYTGAAGVSAPTPPPFTVTTVTEEEESDSNEELPSAAIMADRLRRESRWRPSSDDEDDELLHRFPPIRRARPLDSSPRTYGEWRELRERNERYFEPIRATRLGAPSRIEPTESTPEAEGLIAPHARFFIAKNKNKITIKFHPAVSGKYILLKLWSPTHDGNIDIESVQFYGYSGPRFFPATQPR